MWGHFFAPGPPLEPWGHIENKGHQYPGIMAEPPFTCPPTRPQGHKWLVTVQQSGWFVRVCTNSASLTLSTQYRREFADPFWNSQEQNMLTYLFMLMTSWAIVCDVYYLKPTTIQVESLHAKSILIALLHACMHFLILTF